MSLISPWALAALLPCLLLARLPGRARPFVLLAASLLFMAGSPAVMAAHAGLTALALVVARLIRRYPRAKRGMLAIGIAAQFIPLMLLRGAGGFSYAALIRAGFLLDEVGRDDAAPVAARVASLMYFPCLPSGPVVDATDLRARLLAPGGHSWEKDANAALRVVTGLIKKLVLADRLAGFVEAAYGDPRAFGAGALWLAMLAYAVQIYMDFSGAMDVALGVSGLIGIDLPENFRRPYFADSCAEYWRRWHMTMGRWFKARVFYPLATWRPVLWLSGRAAASLRGPRSKRMAAVALPLAITWALVGLWHGTALHYLAWGLANGTVLIAETGLLNGKSRLPKAIRIARTFLVMALVRVLFRAPDLSAAGRFYVGLFRWTGGGMPAMAAPDLAVVALCAAAVFAHELAAELRRDDETPFKLPVPAALVLIALGIAALMIFGKYGPGYSAVEFYYNRF